MFRKTMRFLFVPRTDSPTKAYYAGLISGVYFAYLANSYLKEMAEHRAWEEKMARIEGEYAQLENQLSLNIPE